VERSGGSGEEWGKWRGEGGVERNWCKLFRLIMKFPFPLRSEKQQKRKPGEINEWDSLVSDLLVSATERNRGGRREALPARIKILRNDPSIGDQFVAVELSSFLRGTAC